MSENDLKLINPDDRWSVLAREQLLAMSVPGPLLVELLALCASAKSSMPTKAWLKRRDELVDRMPGAFSICAALLRSFLAIGLTGDERAAVAARTAAQWEMLGRLRSETIAGPAVVRTIGKRSTTPMERFVARVDAEVRKLPVAPKPGELFAASNADLLRGCAWALASGDVPQSHSIAPLLADVALHGIAVNRGLEPGLEVVQGGKVINGCVGALEIRADDAAVIQLARLRQSVTNRSHLKVIDRAITSVAALHESNATDMLEALLPTFGMGPSGIRTDTIGTVTAETTVAQSGEVLTRWEQRDGTRTNSAPKVPRQHEAALRDLQPELKRLRTFTKAERHDLDIRIADDGAIPYERWRVRFVDHPILEVFGSSLIWWCEADGYQPVAVLPEADGALGIVDGSVLDFDPGDVTMRLWHPVDASPGDVDLWSGRVGGRLDQPIAQLERDVFHPNAYDGRSSAASSRYAGLKLRYKPLRRLLQDRRWSAEFLGPHDGGQQTTAVRRFPNCGVQAVALLVATEDPAEMKWVDDCQFEPVRFFAIGNDDQAGAVAPGKPIPVRDVPPTIFSESLRDLALFTVKCATDE